MSGIANMTTGEKRSMTSSMNKLVVPYMEDNKRFSTKEELFSDFFRFWLSKSLAAKYSWCSEKDGSEKSYVRSKTFKDEAIEKIAISLFEELKTFYNPQSRISKKVKLRREKNKLGRNDLCPCGSGKKLKRCCTEAKALQLATGQSNQF